MDSTRCGREQQKRGDRGPRSFREPAIESQPMCDAARLLTRNFSDDPFRYIAALVRRRRLDFMVLAP